MRVIAGVAKGTKLKAPRGLRVRPTTDRAKEALFSVLAKELNGAVILDLYAGTGSLGIEALSRGAKEAVFVDRDKAAVETVKRNLEETSLVASACLLRNSAIKAIYKLARENYQFNLIFLDPPFKINMIELKEVLEALVQAKVLSHQGLVVLEHSSKVKPPEAEGLEVESSRVYGDISFSFYKSEGEF